jgi:putative mRNA 3-end processing factor
MRIVVDINHPGHVHYFKNFVRDVRKHGHEVLVTASEKEITFRLLREYGLDFVPLGSYGATLAKKALNIPRLDMRMLAAVRKFVDDARSDGATPVLLGYALGKAQEILKFLADAGYRCAAHPVVHAVNRVYEAHGVAFPNVRALPPEGPDAGEVVVAPPHLARSPAMRGVRRRRTAILTGWAIDGSRFFRGADAAFPLSDHADFPSLVRYAKATGASRVFTVHGQADVLAAALRKEGVRAEPLREQAQLELL